MKEKFSALIEYGDQHNETFEWYIENDNGVLSTYTDSLKEILVLFKLDVTQELGIVLTFGDTDGD